MHIHLPIGKIFIIFNKLTIQTSIILIRTMFYSYSENVFTGILDY